MHVFRQPKSQQCNGQGGEDYLPATGNYDFGLLQALARLQCIEQTSQAIDEDYVLGL